MLFIVFLHLISLILCQNAVKNQNCVYTEPENAKRYYVSMSTGSDTNSGTSSDSPWKTIAKLESEMTEGTTTFTNDAQNQPVIIYFNNADTWKEQAFMVRRTTGTADNWITFDGETWGSGSSGSKAKFTPDSTDQAYFFVVEHNNELELVDAYINIKGFEFDGEGTLRQAAVQTDNVNYVNIYNCEIHDGSTETWDVGIRIHTINSKEESPRNIHHFNIHHNYIYGWGAHGIAVYQSNYDWCSDVTIMHNTIHTFGKCDSEDYAAGIQCMATVNGEIAYNTIYDAADTGDDGFGIKLERRQRSCDCVVHDNEVYGGTGTHVRTGIDNSGSNAIVYNNYIHEIVNYGIRWGQSDAGSSGDCFNNTIENVDNRDIFMSSASTVDKYENNENGAIMPFFDDEECEGNVDDDDDDEKDSNPDDDEDDDTSGSKITYVVLGASLLICAFFF